MTDGLLTIGAFSRASLVSAKQLRAYHDAGLLVPVEVDSDTGYRRYSVDQLTDAAIIVRLRALDLPLKAVREVLEARDPARTRAILDAHQRVMQDRLAEVERIVASQVPTGPSGALYPPTIDDDGPQPIRAYLPVGADAVLADQARVAGVHTGGLPAVTCAVIVHMGSYESIGDTYRALGAWVARHAEPHPELPVREQYLVSYAETDDPARFRTEICWPVIPADPTT
jgi:DNA-binding transcriptional MerR regulator